MATQNKSSGFSADIANYIQEKTLPLAKRQLVAYQFGDQLTLPKNMGTTYTATRYSRLNLPGAPLAEGVPSVGESMPISQVSATAQQWGDSVFITDVAELTIAHPLFQKAIQLTAMQMAETLERNTFNALMAGSNIYFANSKSNRASLVATDVVGVTEINKAVGSLFTVGAPRFMGNEVEDEKLDVDTIRVANGDRGASPQQAPHYVSILHPLVAQDLRSNTTIATAWSYSDINRLYNWEIGMFAGTRFCESNMVPYYVGATAVNGSATSGGSFASGTYQIMVTETDPVFGYERVIHQMSGNITLTTNQAISVTLPTATQTSPYAYTFNVYVSAAGGTTPNNIGLSTSGPTSGGYAGYATQLTGGQTVVITGPGPTVASLQSSATPALIAPSAPAAGVTVYPTFFMGKGAYGQVVLDNARFEYLNSADKSDPHNQLRVVSWKVFYGTIILNQAFFVRCESGSNYSNVITTGATY
jgi:N4-gp56 family major capsid protein